MTYLRMRHVVPWCSGSTTDCCSSDLGLILTLVVCKGTTARLADGPFWKYGRHLLEVNHPTKTIHHHHHICSYFANTNKCGHKKF